MMSSPRHILKKFLHLELPDNSEPTDRYTGNRRRLHKINQVTLNCVRLILAIDGDSYDHRHLCPGFFSLSNFINKIFLYNVYEPV